MQQPSNDPEVKQLLNQARTALGASNAEQALQCVVQALRRLRGNDAVLPTLRAAAEQFYAQKAATLDELTALLAHVSIAAQQDASADAPPPQPAQPVQDQLHQVMQHHQQQQAMQGPQQQQQQQFQAQQPWQQAMMPAQQQHHQPLWAAAMQHQDEAMDDVGQQQQQQQQSVPAAAAVDRPSILDETGRGSFTAAAMADGSSWCCPHCAGVVPMERQQAHLQHWCPSFSGAGSQ